MREAKVEKILNETEFLSGDEKFEFKYVLFPKIKDMAINYEEKNQLITEAMGLPNCIFNRDYTQGFMDRNQYLFVDRVLAAARLQQLAAANYLYNTRG
ncbi:MAG: hypothetical protein PVH19_09450, partial [Planctomycetia bacterium]